MFLDNLIFKPLTLFLFMLERNPLFITFEGGEGSGKSTQIIYFYQWFCINYGRAFSTREPGGEPIAEKIRGILLDPENKGLNKTAELLLFQAARAQFINSVVNPNLEKGISVLCDRFIDSTTAYQGYGRGNSLEHIDYLQKLVCGVLVPDLTFVIDINAERGLANASKRGKLSRFDAEAIEFHKRVNEGYKRIAVSDPGRCVLIPYEDGIENVQNKIRTEFFRRYKD